MTTTGVRQWLSWHLHVDAVDSLDRLLTDVVAPVVAGTDWFFVRYWLHGPHLRLRIADLSDARVETVERDLNAGLIQYTTTQLDDDAYQRSVATIANAGEDGVAIDPGRLVPTGVYRSEYEPEYARYGGAALLPVSEQLFHTSSDLAIQLCGAGVLARGLEALAVGTGALPADLTGDVRSFLETMRDRWIEWLTAGRPNLDAAAIDRAGQAAAAELAANRPALLAALRGRHPRRWVGWVDSTNDAVTAWRLELDAATIRGVYGSHLHMMQNRLGVGAGNEAYLAAILLHLLD